MQFKIKPPDNPIQKLFLLKFNVPKPIRQLLFLKKGILTTIQDSGRSGHAAIGVNCGGAMDNFSYQVLNILLENPADYPVLEMHFPAPEILFEEECQFALYGADFDAYLNNSAILNGKVYAVNAGEILKFKKKYNGQRCYLGVKGKLNVPQWLNSYSQNSALKFPELPDKIEVITESLIVRHKGVMPPETSQTIRFVPDFEFNTLTEDSKKTFIDFWFSISKDSNRMGYRLEGKPLHLAEKKVMVSSAVTKGTIQLLPDGQIIILMADAQTTGGYPKLGYICSADIDILAQKGSGESVIFQAVSHEDALEIIRNKEHFLNTLTLALKTFL